MLKKLVDIWAFSVISIYFQRAVFHLYGEYWHGFISRIGQEKAWKQLINQNCLSVGCEKRCQNGYYH